MINITHLRQQVLGHSTVSEANKKVLPKVDLKVPLSVPDIFDEEDGYYYTPPSNAVLVEITELALEQSEYDISKNEHLGMFMLDLTELMIGLFTNIELTEEITFEQKKMVKNHLLQTLAIPAVYLLTQKKTNEALAKSFTNAMLQ